MSDVTNLNLFSEKYKSLKSEINNVIVGQDDIIDQILISIFSGDTRF